MIDYRAEFNAYWSRAEVNDPSVGANTLDICRQLEVGAGYGSVLDLGCGDGRLVQALCAKGLDARGIDVSDLAIAAAESLCPGRFQRSSILSLDKTETGADIVTCVNCLEYLTEDDVLPALQNVAGLARHAVYLKIALTSSDPLCRTSRPREWWERRCFEAGLRRHPNIFHVWPYDEMPVPAGEIVILLEPMPVDLAAEFSLSSLEEERTLHMDMAREPGSRSDAHMMRYHVAARYVRPGDRVLDAACGLGYGSHVLRHGSLCASVLGIDGSKYAVNYAARNYGGGDRVRFQLGMIPECLETMEPGSIDFIASFETLEHLEHPADFLALCRKVLSPGGRIMVSVPNDWTEEDGNDPNPYHFHVYDWSAFLEQMSANFLVEKAFCQTASRRKRDKAWITHGREWRDVDLDHAATTESEWCLALAFADPVDTTQPYVDRHHPVRSGTHVPEVIDFAGQYRNPWLLPSLISIGLRAENEQARLDIARRVAAGDDGPDAAAARCVEGYSLLSGDYSEVAYRAWRDSISPFVDNRDWESARPIEVRWAISLLYLCALLERKLGALDAAVASFTRLTQLPFLNYSPLIATKIVDACYELGISAWMDGNGALSRQFFLKGVETAKAAVTFRWDTAFGAIDEMPRFVLSELSEILDLATRCAMGLRYAGFERLSGWIALNTIWSRKYELVGVQTELSRVRETLSRAHRDIDAYLAPHGLEVSRLNDAIAAYEGVKTEFYEPQIKSLETEVARLNSVIVDFATLKADWYEPELASLQTEVARLNGVLADFLTVKGEWYEPQLASRSDRIASLEGALLDMQARNEDLERAKTEFYEPELARLQVDIQRMQDEIKSLQAP